MCEERDTSVLPTCGGSSMWLREELMYKQNGVFALSAAYGGMAWKDGSRERGRGSCADEMR